MKKISSVAVIRVWLVLLVMVNAWVMTQSVLLMDSARDFSFALDIAQGIQWRLMGPEFGGFIHTGPIWFYLLAVPLLSGSLWLTAFFIGVLASFKFVLAFYLGKSWINARFGVLWSACFLIPGWHSINSFVPAHVNVIETTVLAFVFTLWRYLKTRQSGWLYLSGFLLALSMHAHVTAMICVILYVPVLWRTYGYWRFTQLLITALFFLLLFLPYLSAQIMDGFGDWTRWQELTQEIDQNKRGISLQDEHFLVSVVGNLKALLIGGVQRIHGFVASVWPIGGAVFNGLLVLLLSCIVGHWAYRIWFDRANSIQVAKRFLIAFSLLFLWLAIITALRSFTPFYMLFVLTPLLAFIWAWLLSVGGQLSNWGTSLLVIVLLLLGGFPIMALQKVAYDGQIHLGPMSDVRQLPDDGWQTDFNTLDALTVADSDTWGEVLCRDKVQIHGPGAIVLDLLSALPMRLKCPKNEVLLGGRPQPSHGQLLLMHRSFWEVAGLTPDKWLTPAWGLVKNIQTNNEYEALKPVNFNDYTHPPRGLREKQAMQTSFKRIQSDSNSVLIVSHLLPFYTVTQVEEVTANGLKTEKIMANIGNQMYDCSVCEPGPIDWQIKLRSNDPAAIDIMTLSKP